MATVNVADPVGGTVTVFGPRSPGVTKLPVSDTVRLTVRAACGAGDAVTVNVASPPSVTASPAAMLTSGSSSSFTVTLADELVASTV